MRAALEAAGRSFAGRNVVKVVAEIGRAVVDVLVCVQNVVVPHFVHIPFRRPPIFFAAELGANKEDAIVVLGLLQPVG